MLGDGGGQQRRTPAADRWLPCACAPTCEHTCMHMHILPSCEFYQKMCLEKTWQGTFDQRFSKIKGFICNFICIRVFLYSSVTWQCVKHSERSLTKMPLPRSLQTGLQTFCLQICACIINAKEWKQVGSQGCVLLM